MTQCRELENTHNEKLSDIAVVTLEKYMKNELEEELPEELRNVGSLDYTIGMPCFLFNSTVHKYTIYKV